MYKALLDKRQVDDPVLRVILREVQPVPNESREHIIEELRETDPNIKCVASDAVHVAFAGRPKYWWTDWYVQWFEEELESTHKGTRFLVPYLEVSEANTVLVDDDLPRWNGDVWVYTCMRCRPVRHEPARAQERPQQAQRLCKGGHMTHGGS